MTRLLDPIFDLVCGSTNLWAPGGTPLPFCQRCTGLYVGGVVALVTYLWLRPRPSWRLVGFHFALLLVMVPFGYHWVPQDGTVRTVTGFLFAFGLVYYLLLAPLELSSIAPRKTGAALLLPLGLGFLLVLAAARSESAGLGLVLAWLGFLGLATYGILLATSAVLVPVSSWRSLRR